MRNQVWILVLSILLLSCKQKFNVITSLYAFPEKLKEVSGITYIPESKLLWVIEDSGNANKIYGLNPKGKLEKSITIQNAENIDWEEITKDKEGNLYIGDFGNNENKREDLCIYKIEKDSLLKNIINSSYKVSFAYPEQKEFPPKKKDLLYDVEAFFEFKNNFYLFTKNRSSKFDGTTFLYKVPNRAGFHQAKLLGEFKTGGSFENNAITSATISPDASKVLLLSHSKVWLFQKFTSDNFLAGEVSEFKLNHFSQKEAICFKDNSTLLIADEKNKNTGGFVYETTLQRLEAKP
jgi:hypothetical protein